MSDCKFRIGFGTDLHRLEAGEGIMLGGIDIPCLLRSIAHSDGDVLLHACVDALLGACGEGDIGDLFPDTKEENRNRNSSDFLKAALQKVTENGLELVNFDCNIHLQQPKLSPYKAAIRAHLAKLCRVGLDRINIKAKTGEGVDSIGTGKAIRAEVVALLQERV